MISFDFGANDPRKLQTNFLGPLEEWVEKHGGLGIETDLLQVGEEVAQVAIFIAWEEPPCNREHLIADFVFTKNGTCEQFTLSSGDTPIEVYSSWGEGARRIVLVFGNLNQLEVAEMREKLTKLEEGLEALKKVLDSVK